MYNREYYEQKKKKITDKIQEYKDRCLQRQINELDMFLRDQRQLQADFEEIIKEEEESKKASEIKNEDIKPDKK